MFKRRTFFTLLFSGGLLATASGPVYHWSRSKVRRGLPPRDYQYKTFSDPVWVLSREAILLRERLEPLAGLPRGPVRQVAVKSFQFPASVLRSDHCAISQMAVLLHETGHWSISLWAHQNSGPLTPLETPLDATLLEPADRFTEHLERNEFFVRVRCFAGHGPASPELHGKPLATVLTPPGFWVQKRRAEPVDLRGWDGEVRNLFDQIDRVQLELFYRRDQFQ